ncbi:MAG: hypothetical protein BWX84_01958 [Verrucomicrobia bacterium ADurb.Bin118]|nr:MAG: hypothetical protein BWX84_01958 [Verrucomicrobia bacterium ADurb.Bin118]
MAGGSYKDAAPPALPLPGAALRALMNNVGNGISGAKFLTPFVRDSGGLLLLFDRPC